MEKNEFSPEGLSELLGQLYALPDVHLQYEAAALIANFRDWLSRNFNFSDQQLVFLNDLNDEFVAVAAIKSSYFIQNRLPIYLHKASRDIAARGESQDKVVIVHEDTKGKYSADKGFSKNEELNFAIEYH